MQTNFVVTNEDGSQTTYTTVQPVVTNVPPVVTNVPTDITNVPPVATNVQPVFARKSKLPAVPVRTGSKPSFMKVSMSSVLELEEAKVAKYRFSAILSCGLYGTPATSHGFLKVGLKV